MSSKVALFTDLHLGIYGNSEEWHDTALKWADWIVNDLLEKKITEIFFLGDFFDNRSEISVQTIHVASQILEKFKKFNMVMIVGNHDAYYKHRSDINSLALLKGHDNLRVIDKSTSMIRHGKRVLFVPWECEIADDDFEQFDYVFGHFEIQSFRMNNYTVCKDGISPMSILGSKTDTVFTGHFHNRHSKKFNEGTIHYIGSCFPMDFSDVGNTRGYHILDLTTSDIEFVENKVSPIFIRLHLKDIKTTRKSDIAGNIVKLVIEDDIEDERIEKIELALRSCKPWRYTTEYSVEKNTIDDGDIDSDDMGTLELFEKFYEKLDIEEDQLERVTEINKNLYEKNKV